MFNEGSFDENSSGPAPDYEGGVFKGWRYTGGRTGVSPHVCSPEGPSLADAQDWCEAAPEGEQEWLDAHPAPVKAWLLARSEEEREGHRFGAWQLGLAFGIVTEPIP